MISDILDLKVEIEEAAKLLHINSEVFFDKVIDKYNMQNENTLELVGNYDNFSLLNHLAYVKLYGVLEKFEEFSKEYYKGDI